MKRADFFDFNLSYDVCVPKGCNSGVYLRGRYEIQTIDSGFIAFLNGITIIDNEPVEGVTGGAIDANEFVPGPLYLQGDHSDADYKNMLLRPAI